MQALYLSQNELSYRPDYLTPIPRPGEALVRVRLAGICATDLEIIKGYAHFQGVLGHEFVGVVEEVVAGEGSWLGRRVVGEINLGCRVCRVCLAYMPEHCPRRTVLGIIGKDGVFADYVTLPLTNLHVVPDNVPDEAAVFTEPLAAALRVREQVIISPSERTAVIGPGRLGLLISQVLALTGSWVVVLGRRPESLALPRRLGLETGLVGEFPDNGFDVVVEATGNQEGLAQALRLLRPLGTLVLKSTFHGAATVDLTKLVVGEVTVVGSRCGPFAPALRLLQQGQLQALPLIEAEYPLRDGLAAIAHAGRPGVRKVLLRPG
ncbi:MAG: alcohol dehydrogenase catalytic domain-containing protein [Chloroflexota bacterium]